MPVGPGPAALLLVDEGSGEGLPELLLREERARERAEAAGQLHEARAQATDKREHAPDGEELVRVAGRALVRLEAVGAEVEALVVALDCDSAVIRQAGKARRASVVRGAQGAVASTSVQAACWPPKGRARQRRLSGKGTHYQVWAGRPS